MKKNATVIRWICVTIFALMAVSMLSMGGIFSALLFLLGGAIIAPLLPIENLKKKLKLSKALAIVLAVVLFFAGALASPTSNLEDNQNGSVISTEDSSGLQEDPTSESSDRSEEPTEDSGTVNEEPMESSDEVGGVPDESEESTTQKDEATSTPSGVGAGTAKPVSLSSIPSFSGSPYVVVNNNVPNFSASELKTVGYETYSELDSLGRVRVALASVGKDTMPPTGAERGDISSIKPSGWIQAKYDCVSGGWLYNRCHLIGWQLSAENANKKNLMTGTKYLNISGMLPFENMVDDYIEETGNHVAYRITPIYDGNNLLASGVQMEAYSVEDNGEGIQFNVYCYNVQPGVNINYKDGSSTAVVTIQPEETTSENNQGDTSSEIVYITKTGKKYHSTQNCSGLSNANAIYEATLEEAEGKGLGPCSKCH